MDKKNIILVKSFDGADYELLPKTISDNVFVTEDGSNEVSVTDELIRLEAKINNGGGTGGATDYNALSNKPKVNNVTLSGNKTLDELGIQTKGNYMTTTSPANSITSLDINNWNNKGNLKSDGSIAMDSGYNPTNKLDIVTKNYADGENLALYNSLKAEIPTNNNQLVNGAGYLNKTQADSLYQEVGNYIVPSQLALKQDILTDVNDIKIVESMPITPEAGVMYIMLEV